MTTTETWKPIAGYEGSYEVSDQGNIRSTGNVQGRWGKMPARTMKRSIGGKYYKVPGKGYWQVKLSKDHKSKLHRVCRLVAIAFIPNPQSLPQVDHGKEGPLVDAVRNLSWVTNQENQIRAVKNGQHMPVRGERQPTHKLTAEQVLQMREMHHKVKSCRLVSRAFGISKTQTKRIIRREAWAHI